MGKDKSVFNSLEHDNKVFTMRNEELYTNMYSMENKAWSIIGEKFTVNMNNPLKGVCL